MNILSCELKYIFPLQQCYQNDNSAADSNETVEPVSFAENGIIKTRKETIVSLNNKSHNSRHSSIFRALFSNITHCTTAVICAGLFR